MSPLKRRLLAGLSGLLLWASFPNPLALGFEAWTGWVAWFSLVPLLGAVWGQGFRAGFRLGLLAGLAFFLPGLAWLTNVKPMGLAAQPAWLALAAWCALFPALWACLARKGSAEGRALPALWLAATWTLLEVAREWILTGFPWVSLGSSQVFNPALLPLAAVIGLPGLHFSVALGNAILFGAVAENEVLLGWVRSLTAVLACVLLALAAGWGVRVLSNETGPSRLRVAVVQGGIDFDQAWDAAYRTRVLDTYLGLSARAVDQGAKALLWPESAFPGFFNEDGPEAQRLKGFCRSRGVHLVTGSTLETSPGKYQNTAVWIDPQGNTKAYAKRHLVPFGEFMPFRRAVPLLDMALERLGVSDFQPGGSSVRFNMEGVEALPLICYESVFPGMAREGSQPGLLLVLTVDTWYGRSAGPVWHASQCLLRAVENGTWVARAASTGISLFATPQGRFQGTLPLDGQGYVLADVQPARPTPYRRHGDWFTLACLMLAPLCWLKRRRP